MFGHDDKNEEHEEHTTSGDGEVVQPISTTPPDENLVGASAAAAPAVAPATDDDDDGDISKIVDDINANTDDGGTEDKSGVSATPKIPDLAGEPEKEEETPADDADAEPTPSETPAELLEVKKSALQELSPLLDELDQTADEKLNILMMTIQATDDQALIPQAFETAKKIDDKKARAEAMLDIIQEINYFTKKK